MSKWWPVTVSKGLLEFGFFERPGCAYWRSRRVLLGVGSLSSTLGPVRGAKVLFSCPEASAGSILADLSQIWVAFGIEDGRAEREQVNVQEMICEVIMSLQKWTLPPVFRIGCLAYVNLDCVGGAKAKRLPIQAPHAAVLATSHSTLVPSSLLLIRYCA